MLVLSRKEGEVVNIDSTIKVTVVSITGNRVRIGIEAPKEIRIMRGELTEWSELSFEIPCPVEMPQSSAENQHLSS